MDRPLPHTADRRDAERDAPVQPEPAPPTASPKLPREIGGRKRGLEPTRYGDWEKDGRCIDF